MITWKIVKDTRHPTAPRAAEIFKEIPWYPFDPVFWP